MFHYPLLSNSKLMHKVTLPFVAIVSFNLYIA